MYLDDEFQFVWTRLFKVGMDSEWSIEVSRNSIIHNNELSLRWCYLQGFIKFKLGIVDWFVEVKIIKNDLTLSSASSHYDVIIED